MDLNVAIRTAIVADGWGHFSVGGGVVYDSGEEAEYEETLHKGRTLFRLIEGENLSTGNENKTRLPFSSERPTAHEKIGVCLDK
jgi:hypothetical protein